MIVPWQLCDVRLKEHLEVLKFQISAAKKRKLTNETCWRKKKPHYENTIFIGTEDEEPLKTHKSPILYFKHTSKFFDDELIQTITNETNLYSVQISVKCINTTSKRDQDVSGDPHSCRFIEISTILIVWE